MSTHSQLSARPPCTPHASYPGSHLLTFLGAIARPELQPWGNCPHLPLHSMLGREQTHEAGPVVEERW